MRTIGKLAKDLDINVETIRFYERQGLEGVQNSVSA